MAFAFVSAKREATFFSSVVINVMLQILFYITIKLYLILLHKVFQFCLVNSRFCQWCGVNLELCLTHIDHIRLFGGIFFKTKIHFFCLQWMKRQKQKKKSWIPASNTEILDP